MVSGLQLATAVAWIFQKLECYDNQTPIYLHYLLAVHAQRTLKGIVHHTTGLISLPKEREWSTVYNYVCHFIQLHRMICIYMKTSFSGSIATGILGKRLDSLLGIFCKTVLVLVFY